jgi:hypothetical protein
LQQANPRGIARGGAKSFRALKSPAAWTIRSPTHSNFASLNHDPLAGLPSSFAFDGCFQGEPHDL